MNRRAFISKTALTTLAAPLLPAALAKTAPSRDTTWSCIALRREGMGYMGCDATLHTNEVDDVIWFVDQFMDDGYFYRLEVYANGRLFMSFPVSDRAKDKWIPIYE